MLRILFSRLGKPHIGSPKAFSFNVASISGAGAVTMERGGQTVKERRSFSITGGMCPRCEGPRLGHRPRPHPALRRLQVPRGGRDHRPRIHGRRLELRLYTESGFFDPDKPIRKFTKKELQDFLHREPTRMKIA